jgi:hypothetical protein
MPISKVTAATVSSPPFAIDSAEPSGKPNTAPKASPKLTPKVSPKGCDGVPANATLAIRTVKVPVASLLIMVLFLTQNQLNTPVAHDPGAAFFMPKNFYLLISNT